MADIRMRRRSLRLSAGISWGATCALALTGLADGPYLRPLFQVMLSGAVVLSIAALLDHGQAHDDMRRQIRRQGHSIDAALEGLSRAYQAGGMPPPESLKAETPTGPMLRVIGGGGGLASPAS